MSENKHAPGPWSFEALCFDRKIAIKGGVTAYGRPYTVAHVNRPGSAYAGQDKANARLIAAAPELLEALKMAERFIYNRSGGGETTFREECLLPIIAKAEAPQDAA